MTGVSGYLEDLMARQQNLRNVVDRLGGELERLACTERLDELARQFRGRQTGSVVDWDSPFLLRRARAWAVVGPVGIPDGADVVGEAMSLQDSGIHQPDLKEYREKGYAVFTYDEFLDLLARLREQVLKGQVKLPYHPAVAPKARNM